MKTLLFFKSSSLDEVKQAAWLRNMHTIIKSESWINIDFVVGLVSKSIEMISIEDITERGQRLANSWKLQFNQNINT